MSHLKPIRGATVRGSHPLARGLFNCWLLNEGGGDKIFDAVERRIALVPYGATWNAGRGGPCLRFDDSSGYAPLAVSDARYNSADGFSWSIRLKFWQLPSTAGTTPILFDYQRSGGHYWYLRGQTWDDRLGVVFYDESYAVTQAIGPIAELERWYDVAFVYEEGEIRLFVDGVLWDLESPGSILTGAGIQLRIGYTGAYTPEANIEYVMFWDRPLSADEIRLLHQCPYAMFERPLRKAAFVHLMQPTGQSESVSQAEATAGRVERGPWLGGRVALERGWLRSALLGGADSEALRLGTALCGGWFWLRRSGCSALYRGTRIDAMDFDRVLSTAAADAEQMSPPSFCPHNVGARYLYTVRRFNGLGIVERTLPAARVAIGGDGELEAVRANGVFGLDGVVVDGDRVRLTWFYDTVGQADEPSGFRVYGDGGTGSVDFDQSLGTVEYEGRRYYTFTSEPLETGSYRFAVRAVTLKGVADPGAEVWVDVRDIKPADVEIVGAETI